MTNQWGPMQGAMGVAGAYAFFATMSLILLIVFFVKLPETKGKSLVEIERYFVRLRRVEAPTLESSIDGGGPSTNDGELA